VDDEGLQAGQSGSDAAAAGDATAREKDVARLRGVRVARRPPTLKPAVETASNDGALTEAAADEAAGEAAALEASPVEGSVAAGPALAPEPAPSRGPSAAVLTATLFLVAAGVMSLSFMLARGGLSIRLATPAPSTIAVASPSPESSVAAPTPTLTPEPTDAASPSASAKPSPTPVSTPTPTGTPDPRLAMLEPCPDEPDCYLYTVRTYDSLGRISRRFSIPVDTILEWNPWITDPNVIHPGDVLRLPPPG
jgi:hypothetical protein